MKILVADDSKTNLALITLSLEKLGHEVIAAASGFEAIAMLKDKLPDLIILDVVMEGMNGFECAKKIRTQILKDWIPIIFLSGSVDDNSIAQGIDAGGDDYLTKPFSEITLAAKIKAMQRISTMRQELYETSQKLATLSATDTLTGVANRLQFNKTIIEKTAHADRYDCLFALLFLDLDKFKTVNDTLGHPAGDLLLIEVTKRLQACLRLDDFLARMGGDEFAILLSGAQNKVDVSNVAEKIIVSLSAPYYFEKNILQNSCSIGIVFYPEDGCTPEALLKHADIAMYQAKNAGRNNYKYFNKFIEDGAITEKKTAHHQHSNAVKKKDKLTVLNCLINTTNICIDSQFIKKCLSLTQVETMPDCPAYFVGLMNLAGKSIPIIDLGARLNLQRTKAYSLDTPIIMCGFRENYVGFIVDKILGIFEINENDLQQQKDINEPTSLFLATTIINREVSFLLNMPRLLIENSDE